MVQRRLWHRWREAFNLIVANSDAVRRSLIADGIEPVKVVMNGIPVGSMRQSLAPHPLVAFAGRLVPEKGADVLLRAFSLVLAKIPEAQLLLLGDGPEFNRLRKMVTDLRLESSVSMPGFLAKAELENRFSSAWLQVVPSVWAEPFGKVAVEAMMRGTAVIASNCGGLSEIVQHDQTGLLFPPGDTQALAAAMLRLLCDRQLAEQMGRSGHEVAVTRFNEDVWIDTFVALYQTLR
jgi:glycosyltransferase involved in cell wall biosynthesis